MSERVGEHLPRLDQVRAICLGGVFGQRLEFGVSQHFLDLLPRDLPGLLAVVVRQPSVFVHLVQVDLYGAVDAGDGHGDAGLRLTGRDAVLNQSPKGRVLLGLARQHGRARAPREFDLFAEHVHVRRQPRGLARRDVRKVIDRQRERIGWRRQSLRVVGHLADETHHSGVGQKSRRLPGRVPPELLLVLGVADRVQKLGDALHVSLVRQRIREAHRDCRAHGSDGVLVVRVVHDLARVRRGADNLAERVESVDRDVPVARIDRIRAPAAFHHRGLELRIRWPAARDESVLRQPSDEHRRRRAHRPARQGKIPRRAAGLNIHPELVRQRRDRKTL